MNEVYNTNLGQIEFGKLFLMFNYSGVFMRVKTDNHIKTINNRRVNVELPFNDDGVHVPVVSMLNGHIIWMAKEKPCRTM